jgi:tetratricopeptide (TPR) repeat protein
VTQQQDSDESDPEFLRLLREAQKAIEEGRISEHDEIFLDFMEAAERHQRENPDPDVQLTLEADRCESEADWDGALIIYQRLLESAVESGRCQYHPLSHLSHFHQLLQDNDKALEFARAATVAARGVEVPLALARALEVQGACALLVNLVSEAREAADAALLLLDSRKMLDLQRGRCLVLRARCRMAAGDRRAAENDLEAAWPYLEPLSGSQFAAGAHSALASWWSTKAKCQAAHGDSIAVESWEKAIHHRRHVATMPMAIGVYAQNALAETLREYSQALLAAGRTSQADQVLAESETIREQIGLPNRTRFTS